MVRLLVKKATESLFIMDTSVEASVNEIVRDVAAIHNGRLKVARLSYELEELAEHGVALPPSMRGLTDEQVAELRLVDEWASKCQPSGGATFNRDVMGRRGGQQPNERMRELLRKAAADARALVGKKLVQEGQPLSLRAVQAALDEMRGAVTIVYPMGLPPHDEARQELENREQLAGTHASLEVIAPDEAQLWFCGKELRGGDGCKLRDVVGANDKSKLVVQLAKRGSGAPPREPVLSDAERKQLMLHQYNRQQQLKELQELCRFFSEGGEAECERRDAATCCIVKPHALRLGLLEPILHDVQAAGFRLDRARAFLLDREAAAEFYEVYNGVVLDYHDMVEELNSGPCVAVSVTHPDPCVDVVARFKQLCGPSDPDMAKELRPQSLRAKYGSSRVRNALHCSELSQEAPLEVEYFFKILELGHF